jgi:hypothetical protein
MARAGSCRVYSDDILGKNSLNQWAAAALQPITGCIPLATFKEAYGRGAFRKECALQSW